MDHFEPAAEALTIKYGPFCDSDNRRHGSIDNQISAEGILR
jgi:hypothetical protein